VTIVLVEQNVPHALALADRAYVLETGSVTLTGTASELLVDSRVRDGYLGFASA
jgi:ABC-type branched-chain amino acid transport systems, ATPase component